MKLSKCTMGILVVNKDGEIGHVVGLTYGNTFPGAKNNEGDVIPVIKWAYKESPHSIHHHNIEIYKG